MSARKNIDDIIIVDFGVGNLRSVERKCRFLGYDASVTSDIETINRARKIILPGVGHFASAMQNLENMGIIPILHKKVIIEETPILGICLGMQLFTNYSEEGNTNGFGWIDAQTVLFKQSNARYKVPHIGWNSLRANKENTILKNISSQDLFYFVHSYYVQCNKSDDILATTNYINDFVSVFVKDHIIGVQFHPEKSHDCGNNILANFLKR